MSLSFKKDMPLSSVIFYETQRYLLFGANKRRGEFGDMNNYSNLCIEKKLIIT